MLITKSRMFPRWTATKLKNEVGTSVCMRTVKSITKNGDRNARRPIKKQLLTDGMKKALGMGEVA